MNGALDSRSNLSSDLTPVSEPAVSIRGLSRSFGPVAALTDVSFDVREGELTALLGENGAGKSTLLKILSGLQAPSSGAISIHGGEVKNFDPATMLTKYGVAIVPQELALAVERSVAENITMGAEPGGRLFPSKAKMIASSEALLKDLGVELDPRTDVGRLNLATQQLVVVARAISRKCRILILDEPTAMLTPAESDRLFDVLRRLKKSGVTIIYVSHRMPEVFALSDQIHVLRDGRLVDSMRTISTTHDEVVAAMVGRELELASSRSATHDSREAIVGVAPLVLTALSGSGHHNVNLTLRPGEILGIAGLPDSGRVELLRNIFGADPGTGGRVDLNGVEYDVRSPRNSIDKHLAYVPGERRTQGILSSMSVAENIGVLSLDKFSRFGLIDKAALRKDAEIRASGMRVKTATTAQEIVKLSGGNQQKTILARWMSIQPTVFLLDEPTRGVDVGAKAEIYASLTALADSGIGIVCSSSDLPELLAVTDRIAVMSEGQLVSVVDTKDASEEIIMAMATGATVKSAESQSKGQPQ
jgi:ABC-type sugar transport system ATPase subunit